MYHAHLQTNADFLPSKLRITPASIGKYERQKVTDLLRQADVARASQPVNYKLLTRSATDLSNIMWHRPHELYALQEPVLELARELLNDEASIPAAVACAGKIRGLDYPLSGLNKALVAARKTAEKMVLDFANQADDPAVAIDALVTISKKNPKPGQAASILVSGLEIVASARQAKTRIVLLNKLLPIAFSLSRTAKARLGLVLDRMAEMYLRDMRANFGFKKTESLADANFRLQMAEHAEKLAEPFYQKLLAQKALKDYQQHIRAVVDPVARMELLRESAHRKRYQNTPITSFGAEEWGRLFDKLEEEKKDSVYKHAMESVNATSWNFQLMLLDKKNTMDLPFAMPRVMRRRAA